MSELENISAGNIRKRTGQNSTDDKSEGGDNYSKNPSNSMDQAPLISKTPSPNPKVVSQIQAPQKSLWSLEGLWCFGGIFFAYLVFGILQEKITRGKYDDEGKDKFSFIMVLVFIQCMINAFIAKLKIIYSRGSARDFAKDHTPLWLYFCAGSTYVAAMVFSNKALAFIPYPTQVIGKACKPIAVLIISIVWAGKRYGMRKFMCILTIVVGVALFMYNPEKASKDKNSGNDGLGWGELFLVCSLMCDGFTGAFQERMRSKDYGTSKDNMMYNMNFYSCFSLAVLILWTGEYSTFWTFQAKYPQVWWYIILFSLCSAAGQSFIFQTVVTFGPLTCSIITTTRKFFTILCSVIFFRNPVSSQQYLAIVLVFLGLFLDIKYGKKDEIKKKPSDN